jgi:hypothetical protein
LIMSPDAEEQVRGAAQRAFLCARQIHSQLDGFRNEPDDPPLRIHSALAVGMLPLPPPSTTKILKNASTQMSPSSDLGVGRVVLIPLSLCEICPAQFGSRHTSLLRFITYGGYQCQHVHSVDALSQML